MQYYVWGSDGKRYGPVDVATLNLWAGEGRLNSATTLETEDGAQVRAGSVPGVIAEVTNQPPIESPRYAAYPRPNTIPGDDGAREVTASWIWGVVGFICCMPLAIVGLVTANRAIEKGNSGGNAPRIFNIVVLALFGLTVLGYGALLAVALLGAASGGR